MLKKMRNALIFLVVIALFIGMPFGLSLLVDGEDKLVLQPVAASSGSTLTSFPAYISEETFRGEMVTIKENDRIALLFHEELAVAALLDKGTGRYFYTNPYDLGSRTDSESDLVEEQASQLLITYYDDENNQGRMNSFKDCIAKRQFVAETTENGLMVKMMLGESADSALYPSQISASSFEALLAQVSEDDREYLELMYERYTLSGLNEDTQAQLVKQYPYLETEDLLVLYSLSKRDKRQMEELFTTLGYTREQKTAEYEKIGFTADEDKPAFSLNLYYVLTENGLSVSVPLSEVSYNSQYFELEDITVLPYFGCGDATDATGELFLPDGSGAVMRYNHDGSKRLSGLSVAIYGEDAATSSEYSSHATNQPAILPVFGNTGARGAFLAVISEGESICTVTGDSGFGGAGYATVYATGRYLENELFYYDDKDFGKNVMAYASKANAGNITVEYLPLADGSNYVDMAFAYRERQIRNGVLTEQAKDPRLILSLLGYVNSDGDNYALTTFEDAEAILSDLKSIGVEGLAFRYRGWTAGGLDNTFTDAVSLPSLLGGKSGYTSLQKQAADVGVELFWDTELSYVRRTTLFDGYSVNGDTCRTLRNHLTGLYHYNYGESDVDGSSLAYAVSVTKLQKTVQKLLNSFNGKVSGGRLSVGSLGYSLNSNYKEDSVVTRPDAQKAVEASLGILAGQQKLMLEQGNAYTWAYVDSIVNLPVTSSGYASTDYDVPFVQMALNSCVEYTAAPINESEDERGQLLKALETGSGLHFVAAYRNQNHLKSSDQSQYYSVDYETLKGEIAELYAEWTEATGQIGGTAIRSHRWLADNVYETVYESGKAVYVNYNAYDYTGEGLTVPARGWVVREGGSLT